MPRIYDSANEPHDFCLACFPSADEAIEDLGNVGQGPDGRGNCFTYDAEHPDYEFPPGEYRCEKCKVQLLHIDDSAAHSGFSDWQREFPS